jgi:hypothetical protein
VAAGPAASVTYWQRLPHLLIHPLLPHDLNQRSCFVRWEDRLPAFHFDASAPFHSIMVPTVDTTRYGALLAACLAGGRPVLLVGDSGVGKSALVARQLARLGLGEAGDGKSGGSNGFATSLLTCSALTGPGTVQAVLLAKLARRQGRCDILRMRIGVA